jgi:hypothetical protein
VPVNIATMAGFGGFQHLLHTPALRPMGSDYISSSKEWHARLMVQTAMVYNEIIVGWEWFDIPARGPDKLAEDCSAARLRCGEAAEKLLGLSNSVSLIRSRRIFG